jgi:hypothetical protein
VTGILFTQCAVNSPVPAPVVADFWAAVNAATIGWLTAQWMPGRGRQEPGYALHRIHLGCRRGSLLFVVWLVSRRGSLTHPPDPRAR